MRDFVRGVRDGIVHDAETRGWAIWRDEPAGRLLEPRGDGYALNRTAFYEALKAEFENYSQQLRNPDNQEPRRRFVEKMGDIVKKI